MLAGNTLRTRSYLQQLSNIPNICVEGLFYGFETSECIIPALDNISKQYFISENIFIPDFSEAPVKTFERNNWKYAYLSDRDVNSENVINAIRKHDVDIIVFSGYGGQILKKEHFFSETPYLHMHPGELPIERGSTTIYYSILNQRKCSVTAFYMTADIDSGNHILIKHYNHPPKGMNMDQYFDNVIRSDCFKGAIEKICLGSIKPLNNQLKSEEYYIIHPILKHIAILSLK